MLNQFKTIHFVGIGGIGMSGLARILLAQGVSVSGSDLKYNPLMQKLQKEGALVHVGHEASQIPKDTQCVVLSTAIAKDNPERQEALRRNLPLLHRADILNLLLRSHLHSVAITGTHGKTTTTALIALALQEQGLDPTVVIGGEVPQLGSNAIAGRGASIVAEVDESDQSLRKLSSEVSVITNIEADHLEHYRDLDEIIEAIAQFVSNRPSSGQTLVNWDDPGIRRLVASLPSDMKFIRFGLQSDDVDYHVANIELDPRHSTFTVHWKNKCLGHFRMNVPGIHNVYNALSTIACSHTLGLDLEKVKHCLSHYQGVNRRFQLIGNISGVSVIDDYGHHPSEIKATLKTASIQKRPITVIFQPHRYSRTQALFQEFGQSFNLADRIILTDIYAASEKPDEFPVHIEKLVSLIQQNNPGKDVCYIPEFDRIIDYLVNQPLPKEIIMTVGAGNITELSYRLVDHLRKRKLNKRKVVYAPLHRAHQERKVV